MDSLTALQNELHQQGQLVLSVKVVPKSSRTEWAEPLADGSHKVRVAAVPEKGKANQELCRFLAAEFAVPVSHVNVISGDTSTRKRVRILGPKLRP